MPEQLSNDALKLAADSTARAITKKRFKHHQKKLE